MAKTNAIILGAGMVGSVMAADLAADDAFRVTIADRSRDALDLARQRTKGLPVNAIATDLADPASVKDIVASHDIVLGALASEIGYQTLRAVLESGKPYCDISFMPENALDLDELARRHKVTAIVDCGVAPGMSNLLAGYGAAQLDQCERIEIYVGGIPRDPKPPFFYKAAFSPADVIEEYTRPARLVENREVVTREALSEPEMIEFPHVGTLEGFNTDGLRSLMFTLTAPTMKEKTLRWPGHLELMRTLRDAGFFSKDPIDIALSDPESPRVRPLDVTSTLLFPWWRYEKGEEDLTVMRVIVTGQKEGAAVRLQWDLLDAFDRDTGFTSMARTTAFPCTILARMLVRGEIHAGPGVVVPEMLASQSDLVKELLERLADRGVMFEQADTD